MGRAGRPQGLSPEMRAEKITTSGRTPGADEKAEMPVFLGSSEERKLNPPPLSEEDRQQYRIEDIDPQTLLPYREFDRVIDPDNVPYHDELIRSISENGVQSQILLIYNPHTGKAYIAEGNHRLGIARHLGLGSVPVQVRVVEEDHPRGGDLVPNPVGVEEARSRTLSLSDLGIVPGSEPRNEASPKTIEAEGTDLQKLHLALEEGAIAEDLDLSDADLSGREFRGGGYTEIPGVQIIRADLSETTWEGVDIQNASIDYSDLSGTRFENLDASGADFGSGIKWSVSSMKNVNLDNARFSGDLSSLEIDATSMHRASFSYCKSQGTRFYGSGEDVDWSNSKWISHPEYDSDRCVWVGDFPGACFDGSTISWARMSGSAFPGGSFRDVVAEGVDFEGCDLTKADLSGGNYTRSKFDDADLQHVDWKAGDFTEASFQGARILGGDMSSAKSFRGASFEYASANATNWNGLNLSGSSFVEAHLEEASFCNVRAEGMSLRGAYAYGSRWDGVDMTGVDLRGACLAAADLQGARNLHLALIDGVDFERALLPEGFELPPGHSADPRWTD